MTKRDNRERRHSAVPAGVTLTDAEENVVKAFVTAQPDRAVRKDHVNIEPRYYTAKDITIRLGVSRSWLERAVASGIFPQPIKFGSTAKQALRRWPRETIHNWERRWVVLKGSDT